MDFQALLVESKTPSDVTASIQQLSIDRLPAGNVTVAIQHTTINYKDALCMQPSNGLVRHYPHVPGIDFAGTVESSSDPRYQAGDQVVLTGWGVGEKHWGGFAQKARVDADWLVPLPKGLSTRHAMAIGTAGMAAMLGVIQLEEHGLSRDHGEVLITGAAGGVGSIATAILGKLDYQVAAVTGRPEKADYLKALGATRIIPRNELNTLSKKPLESATWAGCIDAVGGDMLARVIGQMKYGASIAAVGLAGGATLPTTLIPFLLRGVNLLGIDSVMQPYEKRNAAWQRLATNLPTQQLDSITQSASLKDIPELAAQLLDGKIQGRIVIDVDA